MKNLLENRALAAVVLCAAVVLSVVGIGGAKVRGVAAEAAQYYADNLAGDLAARAGAAQNIVDAARAAVPDASSLAAAETALAGLREADGPAQASEANTQLTGAVSMLYEEARLVLGDEKGGVLQTQYSEFLSRGSILTNEAPAYNELARSAQGRLSGFPASLLARLVGADVQLFGA